MKEKINFTISSKIEIDAEDGVYKSTIQDLAEDNIIINLPVKEGKYLILHTGELVDVIYHNGNDIFKFTSRVIGRKIDNIMVIILGEPQNIKKIQRRNFVRLEMLLDVNCAQISKDDNLLENNKYKFFMATMIDISGGGMRIAYKENLKLNDIVMVTIPIESEEITLKSKVVRIDKDTKDINKYGLSFYDVEEKEREKIMKFIFEIMRKQRKKLFFKGE